MNLQQLGGEYNHQPIVALIRTYPFVAAVMMLRVPWFQGEPSETYEGALRTLLQHSANRLTPIPQPEPTLQYECWTGGAMSAYEPNNQIQFYGAYSQGPSAISPSDLRAQILGASSQGPPPTHSRLVLILPPPPPPHRQCASAHLLDRQGRSIASTCY